MLILVRFLLLASFASSRSTLFYSRHLVALSPSDNHHHDRLRLRHCLWLWRASLSTLPAPTPTPPEHHGSLPRLCPPPTPGSSFLLIFWISDSGLGRRDRLLSYCITSLHLVCLATCTSAQPSRRLLIPFRTRLLPHPPLTIPPPQCPPLLPSPPRRPSPPISPPLASSSAPKRRRRHSTRREP